MSRPDLPRPGALPVRIARSRAVLGEDDVRALFGKGYRLRGSEYVVVSHGAGAEVRVPVASGERHLILDAIDRHTLGDGPPLRLRGPAGSAAAPPPCRVRRSLALPESLFHPWGLEAGQRVVVAAGATAFGVTVEAGETAVALDRADALAAGLEPGDTVRLARDLSLTPPHSDTPASEDAEPDDTALRTGRLITETDVRQARLRGRHIIAGPDHILTPAARSLGRELGVLRFS